MNNLEILREENFPVTKTTFDFIQQAYSASIERLCRAYGDNLILYGVDADGTNRTAGAVVINGELLPFEQSPGAAMIKIVENVENVIYRGGELLPAYYTRKVVCAPDGDISLSSLRRVRNTPTDWVSCLTQPSIQATSIIQCRINERGRGQLRGRYKRIEGQINYYDFNLPAQFAPAFNQMSAATIYQSSVQLYPLIITSDSRVRVLGMDDNYASEVNLNCEFDL